ncbi:MAG: hypothetical protein MJ064_00480 [Lachnospiraceae bacterium]|nr:hypothetical protein [Lachnospiraceae bacterium]
MSKMLSETAELLRCLPEDDLAVVNHLVKKLILAWDPDYTKLTADERRDLEEAEAEAERGEYFSHEEVWSDLFNGNVPKCGTKS